MAPLAHENRRGASARGAAVALILSAMAPGCLNGQQASPQARAPDVHFVPTDTAIVRAMLAVAEVGREDVVYDLGCGDGRIIIMAVKRHGARGVCVDIDPVRITESRNNADSAGVAKRIRFHEGDLFETDLREATVVTLYLLPQLNERLRPKLFRELRPGSRVVSNAFDMGEWKADSVLEVRTPGGINTFAYFWVMPADVAGVWKVSRDADGQRDGSGRREYEVRLAQQYQQVSGTAATKGRALPLTGARLHGDTLGFTIRDTLGTDASQLRFTGRVKGDRIAGEVTDGNGGSRSWSAVRTERGARPEREPADDSAR